MSQLQKETLAILLLIFLGILLLPGCSLKIGRHYGLEASEHSARIFCAPCFGFGERGKGVGLIFFKE